MDFLYLHVHYALAISVPVNPNMKYISVLVHTTGYKMGGGGEG